MNESTFIPEGEVPKFPPGTDPERAVIAPNMMVPDLELEMSRVMKGITHSGVILTMHNAKVLSKQMTGVMSSLELLARSLDQIIPAVRKQSERVETLINNQKFLFDELIVTKYKKNAKNKGAKKGATESEAEEKG